MNMDGLYFEVPLKKFKTGGAKVGVFEVCILNTGGRIHDTMQFSAMGKTQGMTQLVHCGFLGSFQ
jgi:hypothetical protein